MASSKRYIFDIEADGLLDTITKIHCLVLLDLDTNELLSFVPPLANYRNSSGSITDGLEVLSKASTIVGHNIIKYDIPALQEVYSWDPPEDRFDTLVASRLIWTDVGETDDKLIRTAGFQPRLRGSHSLRAWGERLGIQKGSLGGIDEEPRGTTDWSTWTEEMQVYCEQDVKVTRALYDHVVNQRYSERALELEHRFANLIWKQEQNGIGFNVKAARVLLRELERKKLELDEETQKVFPPWYASDGLFTPKKDLAKRGYVGGAPLTHVKLVTFNPASRAHIAECLKKRYGWEPTELTETGLPKVDETVLSKLDYPEAQILMDYLTVDKRIGQLAEGKMAWLRLVKDGKIHGSVNTNGAVTGRCTHSYPNVSQVPSCHSPYGKECRSLFTPTRPGWKQVGADASGLELRCLAHYMARYDGGAYAKEILEGDIHTANQRAAELATRDQAKTFIYALLYGAGAEKIGTIIAPKAPVEEKIAKGKKLRKRFLEKTPALSRLIEDVQAAAKSRGYLVGLDGRKLNVRTQFASLNTLLQSAGALVMKQALVIFVGSLEGTLGLQWGREFALLANIHDEFQVECRKDLGDEIGKRAVSSIREAGEHFAFRCRLDGEYKIGNNWGETH